MNKLIGERELVLCGQHFILKPSFEALTEIESINRPLTKIIQSFANGDFTVKDVSTIIFACAKKGTPNFFFTLSEIGEMVLADGLMVVAPTSFEVISNVLSGDDDRKKNVEAMLMSKKK